MKLNSRNNKFFMIPNYEDEQIASIKTFARNVRENIIK